jgi:transcriptional regulator with XRE-family HTH domain
MTSPGSPRKIHLVGSRIRELRKGRRLTQTELSEKIGVAQSDLSRMEQGEYKVGMGEFFGETAGPDETASRELVTDYEALSTDAQREVRDFVRFKKMLQEQEKPREESAPGASHDRLVASASQDPKHREIVGEDDPREHREGPEDPEKP